VKRCRGSSRSLGVVPSPNASACGAPSALIQVTALPRSTLTGDGAKAKLAIETVGGPAAALFVAAGWTTILRSALPTAIVVVFTLARTTALTSFEPSVVTQTVLSSEAIQYGCLPTARVARSTTTSANCPGSCDAT